MDDVMVQEQVEPAGAVSPPVSDGFTVNPELLADEDEILPAGVYLVSDEVPNDRVELFRCNGRIYTVARHANPQIAFRFMRAIRKKATEEAALADMLYEVLGDAVMDALADEELTEEQLTAVMKAVKKHTMGAMQKTLGN